MSKSYVPLCEDYTVGHCKLFGSMAQWWGCQSLAGR